VRVDPERLAHVLEHTVRNAQQATAGSGRVAIVVVAANDRVAIEIADTGCGMQPDFVRDRLFRPFQSTKGSQGMGIGAFQTREFVREVGGTIHVSSEPGRGTTIRIELPASRLPVPGHAQASADA
jgi:signal transduction histidine kinase